MLFGYPGWQEGEVSRITQFQTVEASVARPTDTHRAIRKIDDIELHTERSNIELHTEVLNYGPLYWQIVIQIFCMLYCRLLYCLLNVGTCRVRFPNVSLIRIPYPFDPYPFFGQKR